MSIIEAQTAVRRRLAALTPSLPTAFEGIPFTPPTGMYQRLQFVINSPTDPTFGTYFYRENIQVQIFVADKLDVGTTGAITRAQVLRDWFCKGLTLEENGVRMYVLSTPQIAGASVAGDRVIVPVLISLTVEVYQD
ncbi:MAG: phage tail terminator-like protein [Smithella sp.]